MSLTDHLPAKTVKLMTEIEARALLRNSDDGVEVWMADQPWEVAPGGWMVTSELQGCRFTVNPISEALRLTAWPPSGLPATWEVLPR
jgi:hypothetical protein